MLLVMPMANATLIGDTVQMGHYFSTGICCGGITDVVVEAGNGDATEPYFSGSNWYTVDVEASSLSVVYGREPSWAGGGDFAFNGLRVTGLDWVGDASGFISGIVASSSVGGFDLSRFSFTDHSVSINWSGLSFEAGSRFDIELITSHAVPEPSTLILLGVGLLGLGLKRRKLFS